MAATTQQKLDFVIHEGVAKHDEIRWGSGFRNVIKIGFKAYQYKKGSIINNRLEKY